MLNVAWGSTHKSKLMALYRQQKHASRLIFFESKQTHARPLMRKINALNMFQVNILQKVIFMFKLKTMSLIRINKKTETPSISGTCRVESKKSLIFQPRCACGIKLQVLMITCMSVISSLSMFVH